jgi:hypothetical protein
MRLLKGLATVLGASAAVRAAYRALLQAGGDPPRLVVGLELDDPAAERRLLEVAGRTARELDDREVDFVAFGEGGDGGVGSWMQLHTRPFYRRGSQAPPP